MIKKLDKLILTSFFGPFFLTFFITVFILMLQFMLKYFDDIIGKGLEFSVLMEFLFYFSIRITPDALPLAILLSSLMTFGNLGEHFELTAIKSAGISLTRAIRPIFIFSVLLSIGAFFSNNYIVPAANLKALSLLYDIKEKKPSLDLKAGQFYAGIPNYSIKVNEKLPDDITLLDVIIYDHTRGVGNNRVIYADSSLMYTFMNERYLMFELFNGNLFEEFTDNNEMRVATTNHINDFTRNKFSEMKIVFSLASFDLKRTKEDLFSGDYRMKKIHELRNDIDSMKRTNLGTMFMFSRNLPVMYTNHMVGKLQLSKEFDPLKLKIELETKAIKDSLARYDTTNQELNQRQMLAMHDRINADMLRPLQNINIASINDSTGDTSLIIRKKKILYPKDTTWQSIVEFAAPKIEADIDDRRKALALDEIMNSARNMKTTINSNAARVVTTEREMNKYSVEMYRKYAQAAACFSMFLIGAPLGAIIKKGGLGAPVIISIFFYILYYVLNLMSIKWAREAIVDPMVAAWISNIVLFPIGLFFLRQARKDARIFDTDAYIIWFDKLKVKLGLEKASN
jgi:lipopolysaccharide export system permease protein